MKQVLLLFLFLTPLFSKASSCKDLKQAALNKDSKKIASYIFLDHEREKIFLSGIKSANTYCLEIFLDVIKGTDAGWTESMVNTVPLAIKSSPRKVLNLLYKVDESLPNVGIINHCGDTEQDFLDEPKANISSKAIIELKDREAKLKEISDKSLMATKNECLKILEKSKKRWMVR